MLTPSQQNGASTETAANRPGKYGPGHEKHPSWPMPAAEDVPLSQRGPQTGTSYRSKSWTDQTNYPKEPVVPYTRPFMLKKQPRPLKTVMEKCEKLQTAAVAAATAKSNKYKFGTGSEKKLKTRSIEDYLYADLDLNKSKPDKLPTMVAVSDRSPQHYNCPYQDVMVVIRDTKKLKSQPQHLTQADLDAYTKSYEKQQNRHLQRDHQAQSDKNYFVHSKQHSIGSYSSSSGSSSGTSGTTAVLMHHQNHPHQHHHHHHQHQKQSSYAQSEGYHSYVSSTTDSSSSVSTSLSTPTPFLDRLRRDTDATIVAQTKSSKSSLCDTEGRDSVVTNSSGSGSSNDTLKWHGSLSDVSTMSGSFGRDPELLLLDTSSYDSDFLHQQQQKQSNTTAVASNQDLKHLIAHSSKVQAPQKHHSESVMFIESQNLRKDDNSDDDVDDDSGDDEDDDDDDNSEIDRQRCFALSRKSMRKIRAVNSERLMVAESENVDDEAVRKLRLFPVSTYTVRPQATVIPRSSITDNGYSSMASTEFYPSARSSVAERINDIELKQSSAAAAAAAAAGSIPSVSTSNYAQQQQQASIETTNWKSEPHQQSLSPPPPLPPPLKPKSIVPTPILPRRSSTSYSLDLPLGQQQLQPHPHPQPSHYQQQFHDNTSTLIGPVICGPAISVDDWVPERPPKNPNLLKQIYKEMNASRTQKRNSCSSNSTSSNNSQMSGAITSSDSSSTIVGQNSDDIGGDGDGEGNGNDNDGTDNNEFSEKKRSLSMATTTSTSMTMNRVQYKTSNKKSLITTSSLTSSLSSSSSSSSAHYATATTLSNTHLANGVYKRTISPQSRPSPPAPARSKPTLYPAPTTLTTSSTDRKDSTKVSSLLISKTTTIGPAASAASGNLPDLLPIRKLVVPQPQPPTTTATTTATATTTTTKTTSTSNTTADDDIGLGAIIDDCSCSDEPTTGTISSTSGCDTSLGSSSSGSSTSSSFKSRSNSLQNSPILTSRQSKNDMASQTDDSLVTFAAAIATKPMLLQPTPQQQPYPQSSIKLYDDKLPSRKKFPEEIDCETLSQDLINHLSSTDRLKCILTPVPESKKISDYISGLYRNDIISQPLKSSLAFQNKPVTAAAAVMTTTTTATTTPETSNKSSTSENQLGNSPMSFAVTTTSNPVFLATSESKAKILSKLNYNFNEYKITQDTKYLQKKKMELINRLNRKLDVLRIERNSLDKESVRNNNLGANIANHLTQYATSRELVKFQMYIEEIDKITNLLLSLTLRLVRTENIILISECANEKKILEEKRLKLHEQLKDAKKLKESIQRKSLQITKMLNKYLNNDELCDYNHFINWKAKLIIETREINDKIELSENQIQALKSSLNNI